MTANAVNPFNVQAGQEWSSVDQARPRTVTVIDIVDNRAQVKSGVRISWIHLTFFGRRSNGWVLTKDVQPQVSRVEEAEATLQLIERALGGVPDEDADPRLIEIWSIIDNYDGSGDNITAALNLPPRTF